LPSNAVVIGGEIVVETAWASAGTNVAIIGDGGSTNRYLPSTTIKTAGRTALTLTGYKYSTADTVDITITNSAAPHCRQADRAHSLPAFGCAC
jgi:hypothetical protein